MNDTEYQQELEYLLDYAREDWVGLSGPSVTATVRAGKGASFEAQITELLALITDLIGLGALPGDLNDDLDTFLAWPSTTSESLERIRTEVRELGRLPETGEICWLHVPENHDPSEP